MNKCQVCDKLTGRAHAQPIDKTPYFKIERSCYKCSTVLELIFEGDSLFTTMIICDGLKLEIDHKHKTSVFYKRSIRELAAFSGYVSISWDQVIIMDEEYEFDIQNIKEMKRKMETMLLFS